MVHCVNLKFFPHTAALIWFSLHSRSAERRNGHRSFGSSPAMVGISPLSRSITLRSEHTATDRIKNDSSWPAVREEKALVGE